jgi:secreted trypsin-like serine protease
VFSRLASRRLLSPLSLILIFISVGCSDKMMDQLNEFGAGDEKPGDCTPGQIEDVGIVNGRTVVFGSWMERSTVYLRFASGSSRNGCTGTLISRSVVLTSAACALRATDGRSGYDVAGVAVFSANPACQKEILPSRVIRFKKVSIHPGYHISSPSKNDVALIRLQYSAPSGFGAAVLASTEDYATLRDSDEFVAAGFGRTQGSEVEDSFADRLRATPVTVFPFSTGENFQLDQETGGICLGDNGGPLFAKLKDRRILVGVHSVVAGPRRNLCSGIGVVTSVEPNRDFLIRAFSEIAPGEANPF